MTERPSEVSVGSLCLCSYIWKLRNYSNGHQTTTLLTYTEASELIIRLLRVSKVVFRGKELKWFPDIADDV